MLAFVYFYRKSKKSSKRKYQLPQNQQYQYIICFSLIKEKSSGVDELNCYSDTEILASADTDLTLAQSKLYIYSKVVLKPNRSPFQVVL